MAKEIEKEKKGILYLIPNSLGDASLQSIFPDHNKAVIAGLSTFITENLKSARRFLKKVNRDIDIDALTFHILDEHTLVEETRQYLDDTLSGKDVGLLSEAGTPCIADPGSIIVRRAHLLGIRVIPLIGPNSLILALMASGFNGQQFVFHGYLPIPGRERYNKIREIEKQVWQHNQTQLFIETPYRNIAMFEALLKTCREDTELCIACNITLEDEYISTRSIREWKNEQPDLHKKPAVFLLYK
ncbi:MAG: SAM-dependent methyltransferase [Bacteroidota bacterium]|nr:SAM-dependent methyltransferase [Bacteroidota bacterium]